MTLSPPPPSGPSPSPRPALPPPPLLPLPPPTHRPTHVPACAPTPPSGCTRSHLVPGQPVSTPCTSWTGYETEALETRPSTPAIGGSPRKARADHVTSTATA